MIKALSLLGETYNLAAKDAQEISLRLTFLSQRMVGGLAKAGFQGTKLSTQHKSLIGALSFNFARHRQLRQHAVSSRPSVCPPL